MDYGMVFPSAILNYAWRSLTYWSFFCIFLTFDLHMCLYLSYDSVYISISNTDHLSIDNVYASFYILHH